MAAAAAEALKGERCGDWGWMDMEAIGGVSREVNWTDEVAAAIEPPGEATGEGRVGAAEHGSGELGEVVGITREGGGGLKAYGEVQGERGGGVGGEVMGGGVVCFF